MVVAQIRRQSPQRRRARGLRRAVPDVRAELHEHRIATHRLQARLPKRGRLDQVPHPGERFRTPRGRDHQRRLCDVPHRDRPRTPDELGPRIARGHAGGVRRRQRRRLITRRRDHALAPGRKPGPAAERAVHRPDRLATRRIDVLPELDARPVDGAPGRLHTGHGRMDGARIRAQAVPWPEGLPHVVHHPGASRLDLAPQRLPPRLELRLDGPGDGGRVLPASQPGQLAIRRTQPPSAPHRRSNRRCTCRRPGRRDRPTPRDASPDCRRRHGRAEKTRRDSAHQHFAPRRRWKPAGPAGRKRLPRPRQPPPAPAPERRPPHPRPARPAAPRRAAAAGPAPPSSASLP